MYAAAALPRRANDKARLVSALQQRTLTAQCLELWYHMYGTSMGSLVVYLQDNVGTTQVWKKSGNQGNLWQKARVTLKPSGNYKV